MVELTEDGQVPCGTAHNLHLTCSHITRGGRAAARPHAVASTSNRARTGSRLCHDRATLKILERAGDFAKERDGASTSAAVLLAGLQDLDQLRGEVDASEVGETLADSRIRLLFALHAAASATTAARTDETDKEKLARSEAEVAELRGEVGRLQAEVSRLNAQLRMDSD